jgi:hypothetical protein
MTRWRIGFPRPSFPCLRPSLHAGCLGLALWWPALLVAEESPRYLFFNIAPASVWNQNRPETFSRAMFDRVARTLQAPANPRLRVGVSFVFNTLETPTNVLARSLRGLLKQAEGSRQNHKAASPGRRTPDTREPAA